MNYGKGIRHIRILRMMDIKTLSHESNISEESLEKIEEGYQAITYEERKVICNVFKIPERILSFFSMDSVLLSEKNKADFPAMLLLAEHIFVYDE